MTSGSTSSPARLRRQLDRPPQLVAPHRPDEDVVGGEQPRQLGVGGAAPVEVGADRQEHDRAPARVAGGRDERVDERVALLLVAARSEQLLELVDGEDEPA